MTPLLQTALKTDGWRDREAALCAAATVLARATNQLEMAEPVDPDPRQFFDRDIRVSAAARLVVTLVDSLTDPALRRLVDGLGGRMDAMPRLPGSLDQAIDSVDVLTNLALRRAAGPTLGLPPFDGRTG